MAEIKASDLPGLVGKVIVVQVEVNNDDEDFREVRGKCLAGNEGGLVVQTRTSAVMIPLVDIIDVDIEPKNRRLIKRYIDPIDPDGARQHLLDRHGLPYDMLRQVSPAESVLMHAAADHGKLGHEHGPKPESTERRGRYIRPVD